MSVTVKIPTILRRHVGGKPTVEGDGDTLRDLLSNLETQYPGLTTSIVTELPFFNPPRKTAVVTP